MDKLSNDRAVAREQIDLLVDTYPLMLRDIAWILYLISLEYRKHQYEYKCELREP